MASTETRPAPPRGRAPGGRRRAGRTTAAPPVLRADPRRILGIGVGQLVTAEAALALAAAAFAVRPLLLAAAGPLAAAVLVLTFGRRRGRWLHEWLRVRWELHRRTGRTADLPGDDRRLAVLRELVPELAMQEVRDRSGARVGVVADAAGWSVLLEVEPAPGIVADTEEEVPLPLGTLVDALRARDVVLSAVQVVTCTVPTPTETLAADAACVSSYRALVSEPLAAQRFSWLALRLDPARNAAAVENRGGGAAGAQRALLGAATRLATSLSVAGIRSRLLGPDDALVALARCAGAITPHRSPSAAGAARGREEWDSWSCDEIAQATYWVQRWPTPTAAGEAGLPARLADVAALFTVVSLTLVGTDQHGVALRGLVRVAGAGPAGLAAASAALDEAAVQAGAGLVRLDGEQAPAVVASLPLGRVPR